jgi:hypothetical protein
MAGVDKICCDNKKQAIRFYEWCEKFGQLLLKETELDILDFFCCKKDALQGLGGGHYARAFPVASFPESIDKWLYRRCPIPFVRERLREQYGGYLDRCVPVKSIALYIDTDGEIPTSAGRKKPLRSATKIQTSK